MLYGVNILLKLYVHRFSFCSRFYILLLLIFIFFRAKISRDPQLTSVYNDTIGVSESKLLKNTIAKVVTIVGAAIMITNDKVSTHKSETVLTTTTARPGQSVVMRVGVALLTQRVINTNNSYDTTNQTADIQLSSKPTNVLLFNTKQQSVTLTMTQLTNNDVKQGLLTTAKTETTFEDGNTYTHAYNYVQSPFQKLHDFFNFNWRLANT